MLTVPEAAHKARRDPETLRRWIRSGRLRARKVGTQHMIDDADLDALLGGDTVRLPPWLKRTATGEPAPNVVDLLRRQRMSH